MPKHWQAELEAQSASAGKESAQLQSCSALSEVIKCRSANAQRLMNENAELKRKVEALEEQVTSSQVSKHSFGNVISNNCFLSFHRIHLHVAKNMKSVSKGS